MKVLFKRLHPDAIIPTYAHEGDSGFDFYSIENSLVIPGEVIQIKTGLSVDLPSPLLIKSLNSTQSISVTFELQIRPKSGRALKEGLTIVNTPGTIDNGYKGQIIILMTSIKKSVFIPKGEKIAQGVILPVFSAPYIDIQETSDVGVSSRGAGGFGSSGLN